MSHLLQHGFGERDIQLAVSPRFPALHCISSPKLKDIVFYSKPKKTLSLIWNLFFLALHLNDGKSLLMFNSRNLYIYLPSSVEANLSWSETHQPARLSAMWFQGMPKRWIWLCPPRKKPSPSIWHCTIHKYRSTLIVLCRRNRGQSLSRMGKPSGMRSGTTWAS